MLPLSLRGVAGTHAVSLFASLGANALRTWGADQLSRALLDEAAAAGVAVWAGLWVERHPATPREAAATRAAVLRGVAEWAHHPAIAAWVVGNEVELRSPPGVPPASVFAALVALARDVRAADPTRRTAVAVADGDAAKWRAWAGATAAAPNDVVLLVNAYGGAPTLHRRLEAAGCVGAYALGEGLTPGHWEAGSTPWGARVEPPSGAKAAFAAHAAATSLLPHAAPPPSHTPPGGGGGGGAGRLLACAGAFAFFGGYKVEVTPTWYSLLLPLRPLPLGAGAASAPPAPPPPPFLPPPPPRSRSRALVAALTAKLLAPLQRGAPVAPPAVRPALAELTPVADRVAALAAVWRATQRVSASAGRADAADVLADAAASLQPAALAQSIAALGVPSCHGIAVGAGGAGSRTVVDAGHVTVRPAARWWVHAVGGAIGASGSGRPAVVAEWALAREAADAPGSSGGGGGGAWPPPLWSTGPVDASAAVEVHAPATPGVYRLYVTLRRADGGGVEGEAAPPPWLRALRGGCATANLGVCVA